MKCGNTLSLLGLPARWLQVGQYAPQHLSRAAVASRRIATRMMLSQVAELIKFYLKRCARKDIEAGLTFIDTEAGIGPCTWLTN